MASLINLVVLGILVEQSLTQNAPAERWWQQSNPNRDYFLTQYGLNNSTISTGNKVGELYLRTIDKQRGDLAAISPADQEIVISTPPWTTAPSFITSFQNPGVTTVLISSDTTIHLIDIPTSSVTRSYTALGGNVKYIRAIDGSSTFLAGSEDNKVYKFGVEAVGIETTSYSLDQIVLHILDLKDTTFIAVSQASPKLEFIDYSSAMTASSFSYTISTVGSEIRTVSQSDKDTTFFGLGRSGTDGAIESFKLAGQVATAQASFLDATKGCDSGGVTTSLHVLDTDFFVFGCVNAGSRFVNFLTDFSSTTNNDSGDPEKFNNEQIVIIESTRAMAGHYIWTSNNFNFYRVVMLSEFIPCHFTCASCDLDYSINGCLTCTNLMNPVSGFCPPCENPEKYVEAGLCYDCHPECTGCNPDGTCIACKKTNFVVNAKICEICPTGCKTCQLAGVCLTCEEQFYKDTTTTCSPCPTNCKICDNTGCQECLPTFYVKSALVCDSCTINCDTCVSTSTGCTKCVNKFVIDQPNQECKSCPDNCLTCDLNMSCTSCVPNYDLGLDRVSNSGSSTKKICKINDQSITIEQTVLRNLEYDIQLIVMFRDPQKKPESSLKSDSFIATVVKRGAIEKSSSDNRLLQSDTVYPYQAEALTSPDFKGNDNIYIKLKEDENPGTITVEVNSNPTQQEFEVSKEVEVDVKDYRAEKDYEQMIKNAGNAKGTANKASIIASLIMSILFDLFLQYLSSDGFLLKFSMFIKLLTRIKYVNVEYGYLLDKFLGNTGDTGVLSSERDEIEKSTLSESGKYFYYETGVNFFRLSLLVVIVYPIMFILQWPLKMLLGCYSNAQTGSTLLYKLIYFHQKFHLTFYSMALSEVTFYGVHTFVHGQPDLDLISRINYWICFFLFFMVGTDTLIYVSLIVDLKLDKEYHIFHENSVFLPILDEETLKIEKQKKKNKITISKFYEVDHSRSVSVLSRNFNGITFFMGDVQRIEDAILGRIVRFGFVLYIMRLPIYQIAFGCWQSSAYVTIFICLLIELTSTLINYYIFFALKFKWTKVKIGMRLVQNTGVLIFFILCIYLAYIKENVLGGQKVPLTLQEFAIGLIVVVTLCEYLFAILGIVQMIVKILRSFQKSSESKTVDGGSYLKYKKIEGVESPDEVKDSEQKSSKIKSEKSSILKGKKDDYLEVENKEDNEMTKKMYWSENEEIDIESVAEESGTKGKVYL